MGFSAEILADSLAPSGHRLTTFEVTYPRCIHSKIMTHRLLSRNAASSRAIPVEKMIARVIDDPFIPIHWGKNQKGMQADQELTSEEKEKAFRTWLSARNEAVLHAGTLTAMGLHKQIVNRLLEPWMWITVIISATEWTNFFALRCHPDAEPHFQKIAWMMKSEYDASKPRTMKLGEAHLPLIHVEDYDLVELLARDLILKDQSSFSPVILKIIASALLEQVSVGRCARVSYLTHDGKRDLAADIELHDRLKSSNPGHWSPFEHVAHALDDDTRSGNFIGWKQYRKKFETEHVGGVRP